MACEHTKFQADCDVHRLQDSPGKVGAYMLDVRVRCGECGQLFQFLGLEQGLDIGGARCSYDRTEAHLTISPDGLPPTTGVRGFSIKGPTGSGS